MVAEMSSASPPCSYPAIRLAKKLEMNWEMSAMVLRRSMVFDGARLSDQRALQPSAVV
jgi:hypothetical protein